MQRRLFLKGEGIVTVALAPYCLPTRLEFSSTPTCAVQSNGGAYSL